MVVVFGLMLGIL